MVIKLILLALIFLQKNRENKIYYDPPYLSLAPFDEERTDVRYDYWQPEFKQSLADICGFNSTEARNITAVDCPALKEIENQCYALRKSENWIAPVDYPLYHSYLGWSDTPYEKFQSQATWYLGINSTGQVDTPENSWIRVTFRNHSQIAGTLKFFDYHTEDHLMTLI